MYEILISDSFNWNSVSGELFFIRYPDNNPAFTFKINNEVIAEFSRNVPEFYTEYPFGEYRLIVLGDEAMSAGIFTALFDAGIVNKPAFSIDNDNKVLPVCELTDPVVDLLKSYGEYYVW